MPATRLYNLRVPIIKSATALQGIGPRRVFHSSRILAKESELHNENKGEKIQEGKQESLEKKDEGRGEWSESLSSDSESVIKADRGEISDQKSTIEELQKESASRAERERKEEKDKGLK